MNYCEEIKEMLRESLRLMEGDSENFGLLDTTDGYYEWSKETADFRAKAHALLAKAGA